METEGISDFEIIALYLVAKHALSKSSIPQGIKDVLVEIISVIINEKPEIQDLKNRDSEQLVLWHNTIKSVSKFVEVGMLPYLGNAESMLEDILDIIKNDL